MRAVAFALGALAWTAAAAPLRHERASLDAYDAERTHGNPSDDQTYMLKDGEYVKKHHAMKCSEHFVTGFRRGCESCLGSYTHITEWHTRQEWEDERPPGDYPCQYFEYLGGGPYGVVPGAPLPGTPGRTFICSMYDAAELAKRYRPPTISAYIQTRNPRRNPGRKPGILKSKVTVERERAAALQEATKDFKQFKPVRSDDLTRSCHRFEEKQFTDWR